MASLADLRAKYPQYQDMNDQQFADAFYKKFYADMPREQFDAKLGIIQQAPTGAATPVSVSPEIAKAADSYEKARGTSAFADATDAGVSGIPFADEAYSAVSALPNAAVSAIQGKGFHPVDEYNKSQALQAELERRRNARSPIATTVGSIAGGLGATAPLSAAGVSFMAGAKPTLASLAGRGAAEGAAYGGVYGLGQGDGLQERLTNAETGALGGGLVGGGLGSIARIGAGKIDTAALPTADDLKSAAQQAYQRADDAGVIYSKDATQRVADALKDQFTDFGYHPDLQPGAKVALGEMNRLAQDNATLKGLDTARKVAGNAYVPGNKSNNALTGKVSGAIDDLVSNPQPGDVITGDAQAAADALSEARGLYKQSAKLDLVNSLLDRAGLRAASTGSGGNVENTTRQELRKILTSDKMSRGFTADELAAVRNAVEGSRGQDVLRLAGKLSPEGNGLSLILHLLSGTMTGGATLPLAAAGMVAKRGSEALSRNSARIAEAIIANGGTLPAPTLSGGRKAIVQALTRGSAQQLPQYIGQ